MAEAALRRRLGLGLLTLYGVGVMVGAGIYVLVGVAAGQAGVWAPVSFLLAGLVSIPTALSYAELSARIPEAAGDSAYVEHGLKRHWLAVLVGIINVVAGTVAAAAVLRGGVGYLTSILPMSEPAATVGLGAALTLVAILGVVESLSFVGLLTLIEVVGLVLVMGAGFSGAPVADWSAPPPMQVSGVLAASVFAFFAFIGFDDMVNMAEEARDPGRDMPRSIILALGVTGLLYAAVSLAAVRVVPTEVLALSERPLALVWETATGRSSTFLAAIAVAAALNGVLAQIVMAARVLFGLGRRSAGFRPFYRTHARLGTPVLGSVLVGAVVTLGALTLPVAELAEMTTLALVVVFIIVNAALIGLKSQGGPSPFAVPRILPWLGIAGSLVILGASFAG